MNILVITFGLKGRGIGLKGCEMDLYHTYKDAAESVEMTPRKLSEGLKKGEVWHKNHLILIPVNHPARGKARRK